MSAPPRYRELEDEIEKVRADKEAAIEAQEFEKAAQLRDKERKLTQKKKELEDDWRNQADDEQPEIGEDEIADIVSMWTGIPVFKLTEAETTRLVRMEDELHKRVIGQHQAIVAVSKAIRRARAGIKDPKRPTGSFIFLGPSGVGKTELARTLAEFLFGDEDAMIQVDMSEYMEKHSVSRLVGSPPGYVGYDEGGQLTEAVRRKPYSVVLLDEIEKAHPDVFNILLQILEDGKLTDAQGRKVDFRNTIVIMTSNLGAAQISKNQTLGFSIGDEEGLSYDEMKERVMSELKKVFRPELLNRIDEVIVFHKLERAEILEVVDLLMRRVREEMAKHGTVIELTDDARELLVEQGYDPSMGARPLRRAIQRLIEDPLADFILGRELSASSTVIIDRRDNPVDDEPPVVIRIVDGPPVPAAVGAPDEPADEPEADSRPRSGRLQIFRPTTGPGKDDGGNSVRHAKPSDYGRVIGRVNVWWGGREMAPILPRLFFLHFEGTSFVADDDEGELAGFVCGFLSQTDPEEAYIHFVGVSPARRGEGIGRTLYERFFAEAREQGRSLVRCVTSPANEDSIAFHEALGFEVDRVAEDYDGPGEDRVLLLKRLA